MSSYRDRRLYRAAEEQSSDDSDDDDSSSGSTSSSSGSSSSSSSSSSGSSSSSSSTRRSDRRLYEAAEEQEDDDDDDEDVAETTSDLSQRERDLFRGSGPTIDDDDSDADGDEDDDEESSGGTSTTDLSQRERDLLRGSGPTIDEEDDVDVSPPSDSGGIRRRTPAADPRAFDPFEDVDDAREPTAAEARVLAEDADFGRDEIVAVEEFEEDGETFIRPFLDEDARREQAAGNIEGVNAEDIGLITPDREILLTEDAQRERAADEIEGVDADDISTIGPEGEVRLTDQAREERTREFFRQHEEASSDEIDFDPAMGRLERLMNRRSGEVRITDFSEDELEFNVTDTGVDIQPTDEGLARVTRQQFEEDPEQFDTDPDLDPSDGRLERIALRQADQQPSLSDFDADELQFDTGEDGVSITPTDDAIQRYYTEQAADEFGVTPGEVETDRTPEGELQIALAEETRRELIREAYAEEIPGIEPEDVDLREGEDGELQAEARRERDFAGDGPLAGISIPGLDGDLGEVLDRSAQTYDERITQPYAETAGEAGRTDMVFLGPGSEGRGELASALAGTVAGAGNLPALGSFGVRAADEFILQTGGGPGTTVQLSDPERTQETAEAVREAGAETASFARENPGQTTAMLAGGALVGLGTGAALGRTARGARDRIRTAGGERIDLDDIVNPETRRVYDGDGAGDPFPPVQDRDLGRQDPPEAIRQQADDYTPESMERAFREAGETEGSVMFKALDSEPEGPGGGRAAQGLRTQEGAYESPGAFVGPELSPNFLRLGGRTRMSLRPGLPDSGGRPTAVAVRTDVERPDSRTMDDFRQEMVDRSGETTARTKPQDAFNLGEAEAVIPGESTFADLGGGPLRNLARRAGVGSDFYTEIGGRRVPIRTVAPDRGSSGGALRRLLDDDRAQAGAGAGQGRRDISAFRDRELSELGRAPRPATDRPFPVAPTGPSGDPTSDRGTTDRSDRSRPTASSALSVFTPSSGSGPASGGFDPISSLGGGPSDSDSGIFGSSGFGLSPGGSSTTTTTTTTSGGPGGTGGIGTPFGPTEGSGRPMFPPLDSDSDEDDRRSEREGATDEVITEFLTPLNVGDGPVGPSGGPDIDAIFGR